LRKDTSKVTQVLRRDGESFEGLLRRFRKEVQEERVLSETRRRRFYEKPSQERKRKAAKKLRKSRRTTYKTEGSTR
jgi:small subunit ribosomal protein S21